MKATGISTKIVHPFDDLRSIISESVLYLPEESVLVITSKIVSLCEGAVRSKEETPHLGKLIEEQAVRYTHPTQSKYGLYLTIKHASLSLNAGIDQSNADGWYVLLPEKPQQTVNQLWQDLRAEYQIEKLGVVIIDSIPFPLKWGQTARALAHCGFVAVNDRVGELDLFGRKIVHTYMSVVEGIAAAAHLEMGEVAEQRPLAIVEEIKPIVFQDRPPTQEELDWIRIKREDDAFAPLLESDLWLDGGSTE